MHQREHKHKHGGWVCIKENINTNMEVGYASNRRD